MIAMFAHGLLCDSEFSLLLGQRPGSGCEVSVVV